MIWALAFLGYLIGSIPFGLLLTKAAGYGDIRQIGSGNIGATNVLRTGNKKLAALTLLLDGGKGAAAVLLAQQIMTYDAGLAAAVSAFFGHLFPVWLKFKGGKGVATTLGILLALQPALGAACCAIWLAMAMLFRYSSLSALAAIGLSPYIALKFAYAPTEIHGKDGSVTFLMNHHHILLPVLCSFMAVLVFYKHRENIRRLIAGTEPKIAKKKEATATTQ
ncbi:MAG TPA: glycerol-3-phosphate 1-O-acyltransferase PlsY [Patescibacteria group bacterium]|nr:glycerol-3-phosphate 1-O-acyltransferase PlsY [Patescibacteria group bacterium]